MKHPILRLIGFHPSITRQMDSASAGSLLLGFITVLFVATVSAALFAATFSRLCFGGEHYWVLAGIWFLFIWLLDSVVLRSLGSNMVIGIRIGIIGVIALLNSLTFDELLFRRDLANFLKREYQAQVQQVEGTAYTSDFARMRDEREALNEHNINLKREVEASRKYVLSEWLGEAGHPEGQGWRYEAKLATHRADSAMKYAQVSANVARITQLDSAVRVLNGKKDQQVQALVRPEDSGLRDNVNALHRLVFGPEGKPMDKLYFGLLFGLGVILESLVLLIKPGVASAVSDYHTIAREMAKVATDQAINRIQGDGQIVEIRDQIKSQQIINELTSKLNVAEMDHRASKSVDEIEGKIRKAVKEEEAIHEAVLAAQQRDEEMKRTMGGLYADFGQELHNIELNTIRKEIDRLAARSKKDASYTHEPA